MSKRTVPDLTDSSYDVEMLRFMEAEKVTARIARETSEREKRRAEREIREHQDRRAHRQYCERVQALTYRIPGSRG